MHTYIKSTTHCISMNKCPIYFDSISILRNVTESEKTISL